VENEIVKQDKDLGVVKATRELMSVKVTKEDIKNLFCPLATEKELAVALGIVKSLNLNPFIREVHFIKFRESDKISIIVGYEVYIKRADRTGKLNGWTAGIKTDEKVAWVKIWRKDWAEPFYWEVSLEEFNKKQATWNQMPSFMGKKVAIAQGFRLAFPDELGGMPYTKEEAEVYDIVSEQTITAHKPAVEMPKAKQQAPQAEAPADAAFNVLDAMDQPVDSTINVWGIFFDYRVEKVGKDKKDITRYKLSPREGTQLITISKWGGLQEGLALGDVVQFNNVVIKDYKGAKQFLGQEIIVIEKAKEEENA